MLWRSSYLAAILLLAIACQHGAAERKLWRPKADVVFVLDDSDTVGSTDWKALKSMLLSLVSQWTIGPNDTQVSVVSYGGGAYNEFFLNEAADAMELANRLQAIKFHGGTPDAAEAIRFAYRTSFSRTHGSRAHVPHIVVHVTNGPSSNPASLLQEAENAKNNGVTIYNLGVGEGVELDQLAKVASDPSSRYVLKADTYTSLTNMVTALNSRIANEIPVSPQALPPPSGCLTKADLVLLVDSSSSLGQEDFEHLEDFVKDLIVQLPIGHDQVQMGMVQFAGHPSLEFPLNMYHDRMALLKAVESLQFLGGGTNTGDALQYVDDNVYTYNGGARSDVPRVAIVITDGQSVDSAKTIAAAESVRQDNISLIAVGVGSNVNEQELQNIASDPDSKYVFKVANYSNLQPLSNKILQAACTMNSVISAEPTAAPGTVTADPCHDKLDTCYDYDETSCTDYESWARENCLKRCGFCHTAEEVTCENKVAHCETYGADVCTSLQHRQWAHENCKRFCGFCGASATTTGFYGRCMYKGLEYVQSERWQDGCDYECVCEDAQSGLYRCYNRCPVYHNLPPECTLVGVPNECCLQPVCNFNQHVVTSEISKGPSYNAQNITVCEHEGKQYYQGQTWEVGCDLKCICTDSSRGDYRCQSYCPNYPTLPGECRLVQKPGHCCREPVCEFNTETGSFTGYGTVSGRGVDKVPQTSLCEDDVVDCEGYGRSVCTEYASWAQVNCAKFCGLCSPDTLIAGPDDVCYLNGVKHREGETWKIGCDTECICEDGVYGYYRCYSSCPTYLNLPNSCQTIHRTGECCPTMECDSGTYYPSSTNVFSLGNGGGLQVLNPQGQVVDLVPTLPSGMTLPPGTLGGSTGLSNIRLDGCLFNGRMYIQNQQWHDGCNHTCSCLDASTGHISCRQRCPEYKNVPTSCGTQPDPNDPCCAMPDCPASVGYVPIPVYGKGLQSIGAVQSPNLPDLVNGMFTAKFTLLYSGITVAPPTAPSGTLQPGGLDYCEYKGQHYQQGERWEDGCDYNCICENAAFGAWHCVDKCEKYVELPSMCRLEQDPTNTCCQRPVCTFEVGHGEIKGNNTLPPTTTTTTAKPTTAGYWEPKCVYKGEQYAVGQSWYDACSLSCRCDDADKNLYTCVNRCPAYPSEYDNCQHMPDPNDPTCCVVPVCMPTPSPYMTPYPGATQAPPRIPPGIPIIPPGVVTGGNTVGFCEYGGIHYSQDERWEDGCDYTCVCEDAQTGLYKCTEKCERFGNLPSECRLVTDFTNPCCQIPTCTGLYTYINGTGPPPTGSTPKPARGCVYNNAQFQQGQTWQEGCIRNCRCEDAENGLYVCTDRCPTYNNLPPECTLVTDPNDPCCLTPRCVPLAGTTLAPLPNLIPTLAPGIIVGSASFPTSSPGPNGETPGINFCLYKGVPYAKDQTWQDGCDYNCECKDPSSGLYQCTERCTRYAAIPQGCVMVRDAADPCCERPVCSPDLATPTPGAGTPLPGSTLAPPTGSTVSPPTGVVTPKPTPTLTEMCVYKNQYYGQGQKWYDGCDYQCTCEDSKEGIYRCIQRCPVYTDVPPECTMGPDPKDPACCQRPVCKWVPTGNTTQGILVPPLKPAVVTGGVVTPSPMPYNTPTPGPDGSTLEPPRTTAKPKAMCIYNGQMYSQGQKWADGCDYDCVCIDALNGRYQCTEKCMIWSSIPDQCTMVPDPNNPCCKVPYCDSSRSTPVPQSTAAPTATASPLPLTPFRGPDGSTLAPPTVQTSSPPKDRCLYNGVPYMTGDTWEDGCDLKCVCEDGASNIYRCSQRCKIYQLPKDCVLVTDPADSCCRVPYCSPVAPSTLSPNTQNPDQPTPGTTVAPVTGPDGSTVYPPTAGPTQAPNATPSRPPYLIPTGVPGTIIGTVNNPNHTPGNNETMGCYFNGVSYKQGDNWQDGCDWNCVCLNSTVGTYECKERCVSYLNVPPNCQLVLDPTDSCCKVPLCQPASTAAPTATPTPGPNMTPVSGQTTLSPPTGQTGSPTPSVYNTVAPKKMCVYKGQYYAEGQQWYDGCEKLCVCDDGTLNYYRCSDRCPTFNNVPSECQLVASPNDPTCCQVPQCISTPGPNGYPTAGPGVTPTIFTNPTGVVTGIAPTPTPRPGYPTPGRIDACVYKGHEYSEGQQWQDGCDYNCVCVNQTTGFYECRQRCADFPVIPAQCQMVPDPMDFCCKQLQCDFSKPTPNPFATPTPGPTRIPDPNLHTTVSPPSLPATTTDIPPTGGVPTPGYKPPTLAPQFTFCIYNGIPYRQGDSWNVGCDQVCTCDDSTTNHYSCADRCPTYANLPDNCNMVVNPADPCCQVPECYVVPTPGPGVTPVLGPGQVPIPIPTGIPGVIISVPNTPNTGTTTNESGCLRNGVRYNVGDTWQEGCQYNCECLDTTGRSKCTERCIPYPKIPDQCVMTPDPKDACCTVPVCPNPYEPTPTPQAGVSTISPLPTPARAEMCVYNGNSYTQGQQWEDGCDKICVCENAATNFYRCSDRCAKFSGTLDSTCKMVPDPKDPQCCQVPECNPDPLNVTGHTGVIIGYGKPPTPMPGMSTQAPPLGSTLQPPLLLTPQPPADACVYNGHVYTQGQQWQDGCDFNCVCLDATIGQYKCTDRCPRFPQSIASFCRLVRDPNDACCTKPDCSTLTPPMMNVSTLSPPRASTPFPTLHPTLVPNTGYCVYKGVPYTHGQSWNDGCEKRCRCEDVVTGQINCDDRCVVYANTDPNCQLVTDPKDACCQVPQCAPKPGNNTVIVTGPTGTITGNSLPPKQTGPLIRNNECIYHGRTYQQGEIWDDGCSYTCECIDSKQGKYICHERCQRIVGLPASCTMMADPLDQCCQKPYCEPWVIPTPAPGATPSGPTLIPGATPTAQPGIIPTPNVCVYNGQSYRQGQKWYNGCDTMCVCENATLGFYRCQERCVRYTPHPGCIMVPDPQDPSCCEIPKCDLVTPTPGPGVIPTPGIIIVGTQTPGSFIGVGHVPTPLPTVAPTGPDGSIITPTPIYGPDGSTIIPTPYPTTGCYYKGIPYQETQKWEDGCDYVCECIDGTTGQYRCTQKCPILPQVTDNHCVPIQDPKEPCCTTLYCDPNPQPFPNGTPTPYPPYLTPSGMTTLVPGTGPTQAPTATPTPQPALVPTGVCIYKGAYYRQGEKWADGCDMLCVCDNATTGAYTCQDRCKNFGQAPDRCVMKVDPADSCCLVPDCSVPPVVITPYPPTGVTGGVTLRPSYILTGITNGTFTGNSIHPTTNFGTHTGFTNGCVYKQTLYKQDATWQDGCEYLCVCVDSLRGRYQCSDRCPSYYYLPPECIMEQDPKDSCCQQARCYPGGLTTPTTPTTPTTTPTTTPAPTTTPTTTPAPTTTPTTTPAPTTPSTVQVSGQTVTGPSGSGTTVNIGGSVTNHTGTGPVITITPGVPTGPGGTGHIGTTVNSVTGTRNGCVYKGMIYHQGDNWDDGCDLHCTCDDEVSGLYTCTYRCKAYSNLPKYCHLQTDAADPCCKKPVCTMEGTILIPEVGGTPTRSPTLAPSITNVIPLGTHTIVTGSSRPPGTGVQTIYGGRSACIYKGVQYVPGESWDDYCDYTCTCIGNDNGLYRCVSKCPSYPALPQYCELSRIPGLCCESLSCDVPNVGKYNPYPQLEPNAKPTPGPDGIFPTPQPSVDPQLILGTGLGNMTGGVGLPGGGHPIPSGFIHNLGGIRDKCIYDMKMYNQGETWDVGCNYTCQCLDSMSGFYKCTERCVTYDVNTLPAACKMVQDPLDLCCQTPSCPDPTNQGHVITNITQIQQLYPIVGTFTGGTSGFRPGYVPQGSFGSIGGTRDGCVYKGLLHPPGSSWEDGCDFDCQCIDGAKGIYQCSAKCISYSLLPPMCTLVDVEGQCCPKVQCNALTTPHDSVCRDKIDNCYQYRKSSCHGAYEPWAREHCPLFCEFCHPDHTTPPPPCEDAVPNCENYNDDICTNIAYADWAHSNCRKFCNMCGTTTVTTTIWTTPESGCFDAISYCEEYGIGVCTDLNYKNWAESNCRKYCGICGEPTGGSTTPEPCEDLLDACELYGQASCGGQYFAWARHNCRKYCGLCDVTAQTAGSTLTTPGQCVDRQDNCNQYPQQYCEGAYLAWAADNCPARCNLCNYQLTTQTTLQAVTEPGWQLLMKGVTGVPGDIWHLWSTTSTANENVPQAHYLTNQYPGHFKPQIANEWAICQFEKMKVAILKNGVEKANIIFDVRNSGKNDWFRPENVISSTFTDLPTTPGSFGMGKDSTTGHEFSVGQFGDCQGKAWMLISTNANCPYQQVSNGSRFYYSLNSTVAALAPGQIGEGDVFAILGQGGNCMGTLNVLTTLGTFTGGGKNGCYYKGNVYNQGDAWQDGCNFNCTCEDGASGQYYCIDRCPTYENLPAECSLETKPGECCAELKCPFETGEGCYYKNQTYPQGATWQDGCQYDCTCQDGKMGYFTCQEICQDWSSLPDVCHMEAPAPGLCCPRPVCPPPITVDFKPR